MYSFGSVSMPNILPSLFLLALTSLTVVMADELSPAELAELETDCRTEGEASGMSGADLDAYIEECVDDFTDTNMVNTEKGEKVK